MSKLASALLLLGSAPARSYNHLPAEIDACQRIFNEVFRKPELSSAPHHPEPSPYQPISPNDAEYANQIQKLLSKKGIHTHLDEGAESHLRRGLLIIDDIDESVIKRSHISPGKTVFESEEFRAYLRLAHQSEGAIAIDPALWNTGTSEASFIYTMRSATDRSAADKKWVIALHPNSSGSVFRHEWEHKIDFMDRPGEYQRSLLQSKVSEPSREGLSRALWKAGASLESDYLTELNATGKQFDLFFERPLENRPGEVMNTICYRQINKSKVALGRIFMDPRNPDHYVLYLNSLGGRPFVSAVAVYVPAQLLVNFLNDWFLNDWKNSQSEAARSSDDSLR